MSPPVPGLVYTYTSAQESTALPLFESADVDSARCVIFLPGLFDGWQTVPYVGPLRAALLAAGWSLAQPHLPSSYKAFGLGSLARDVELISQAVDHLRTERGKTTVVLMGHSTGCQQIMTYLLPPREGGDDADRAGEVSPSETATTTRAKVDKAILQAPASDRPAASSPALVERIEALYRAALAQGGLAHAKRTLCPLEIADEFQVEAISLYRAWSLFCVGGDDDFFSRDIPSSSASRDSSSSDISRSGGAQHRPLSSTFGRLPADTPVVALCSASDECVPDAGAIQPILLERWTAAAEGRASLDGSGQPNKNHGGGSGREGAEESGEARFKGEMIEGAGHSVSEGPAQRSLLDKVLKFLGP